MASRRDLLSMLAFAGIFCVAGCNSAPQTIRYRLTLYVDTPEGPKTGSGVSQITMNYNDGLLKGLGNVANPVFTGEAVSVDLGSRGIMFCLLSGDYTRKESPQEPYLLVSWAFPGRERLGQPASFYDYLIRFKPTAEIPAQRLLMLVRFRDINDPKTVERVDPNDLAASFGPGVKLVRATIEITDDPVTTGIESRLPWLAFAWERQRALLKGPFWNSDDPGYRRSERLLPIYFSQGILK